MAKETERKLSHGDNVVIGRLVRRDGVSYAQGEKFSLRTSSRNPNNFDLVSYEGRPTITNVTPRWVRYNTH